MTDIIIRHVPSLGYLPILEIDGTEVYRGEYKTTSKQALKACVDIQARINF
jgi:hypothetical protein